MQCKPHLWIVLGLMALFGNLFGLVYAQEAGTCVRGKPTAPVKIEIFSDFQCPACRAFYLQTMRQIFKDYADTGKVCVVYRSYPQDSHEYAVPAARYGQAALRVGTAQWNQVADALFSNQDQWGQSGDIESVLSKTLSKADMDAIRKHMQNTDGLDQSIYNDIQLGISRNVGSTPTFFISGQGRTETVEAALTYNGLKQRLDQRLGNK
jgi:protein-disulfide isomerase